jgi:hypothetical protein
MICRTGRLMSPEGAGGLPRAGLAGYWLFGQDNLLKWSENLTNAAWHNSLSNVSPSTVPAPDGSQTSWKLHLDANASSFFYQGVSPFLAPGPGVFALWMRTVSGNDAVRLMAQEVAVGQNVITVGLTEEWQQFSVGQASTGQNVYNGYVYNAADGAARDVLLWHPQLNQGSAILPYIKTTDLQTILDLSGHGNTLQLGSTSGVDTNDPTLTRAGAVFDGVNDYCTRTFTAALNPGSVSVIVVAKVSGNDGQWRSAVCSRTASGGPKGYLIYAGNDDVWQFWIGDGSTWRAARAGAVTTDWAMVAGISDGSAITAWLNLTKGTPTAAVMVPNNVSPLQVGVTDALLAALKGMIAAVLVYNRALSDAEIARVYGWLKAELAPRGVTLG